MAYSFPGSWGLVKRNLPGLVGAGVGAVAGALSAGNRAYRQIRADPRFVTTSRMASSTFRRPYVAKRKYSARRSGIRRRGTYKYNPWRTIVRSSGTLSWAHAAATFSAATIDPTLNQVQTVDLVASYKQFRIKKCVVRVTPRVDTANSGLANNFVSYVTAACDPEGAAAPASLLAMTAYDNSFSKWVPSGDSFTYTFYPKVINTVDVGGAATAAGSYGQNPWLTLNAAGITVPHKRLLLTANTHVATTVNFDLVVDYHFEVKG